jgi:hypothetical protein
MGGPTKYAVEIGSSATIYTPNLTDWLRSSNADGGGGDKKTRRQDGGHTSLLLFFTKQGKLVNNASSISTYPT